MAKKVVNAAKTPDGLDEKDLRLLEKLKKYWGNYNFPVVKTAKELGCHRTSVYKKIRRLEKLGIIKGYKAVINEKKLGNNLSAVVLVRVNPQISKLPEDEEQKEKIIAEEDRIRDVYEVAGSNEFDTVYNVVCKFEELRDVLTQIRHGIGSTESSQALSVIYTRKENGEMIPLEDRR